MIYLHTLRKSESAKIIASMYIYIICREIFFINAIYHHSQTPHTHVQCCIISITIFISIHCHYSHTLPGLHWKWYMPHTHRTVTYCTAQTIPAALELEGVLCVSWIACGWSQQYSAWVDIVIDGPQSVPVCFSVWIETQRSREFSYPTNTTCQQVWAKQTFGHWSDPLYFQFPILGNWYVPPPNPMLVVVSMCTVH